MKTKLLLYCTKGKPYLFNRIIKGESDGYYTDIVPYDIEDEYLNGKIVAECECEVEEIKYTPYDCIYYTDTLDTVVSKASPVSTLEKASCLNYFELDDYLFNGKEKVGYALHLNNLKMFEKPNNLENCVYFKNTHEPKMSINRSHYEVLHKAPQNMMRVIFNKEGYVLISIRPEWLCKILNGEKPIEVRKKILKGML